MDLSHEPRSIRHFYTVMADRMDYFTVKPKKNSKENYVKLNEDKILKELTDEMDDIEAKWDEKTPKTGDYQDDLRFCENITRDFVKWLNKRYSKYFTITYKCYYKVKKNPPEPEIEDLHLGDELLEKSLDSIKSRDYTWTPSVKTRAHEGSAYWHQLRYLDTLGDSAKTLGISPQGSMKRAYDTYMNKAFEESKFSYYDALNILNLAHDISSADSKIRDGGELSSRLTDICSYLELDETSTETLQFLEEVIHNENLFTEEAKTMCGDFYGLALLSSYAIQAVGAIQSVKEGKKEYSVVEYEVYSSLKEETQKRFEEFLLGEKDHRGYAMGENAPASRGFVDSFLNPPTVIAKRADFEHVFSPKAFAYDFDLVKEALDEFNVEKYEPSKNFSVRGQLYLRFPVTSGKVSMSIALSTGKAQIFVTGRPNPMEDALDAVTKIGTALVRYGLPGIDPEEYDVKAIDAAQNPQTSQVIAIAGPSGAGKSTTIRNLLKLLPNSKTAPTVTTRAKRKSDKPGERIFISVEQFKKEMTQDKLVAAELQKNGNYYGRRKSDFKGADYVIIDVNPRGVNAIKRAYPNAFTVYLEPVEDPEFIRKRLLRRGDMSPQEARGRASIIPAHIKDSKNIDFDARIKTKQGEFSKIALEIEPMIPKQNPNLGEMVEQIFRRKSGLESQLPKRGSELDEVTGFDLREEGLSDLEVMRKELELMDALDKLSPSEREKVTTPVVRKFMRVGGKEILLDQSDEATPIEQQQLDDWNRLEYRETREEINRGYYTRLREEELEGRAQLTYVEKKIPSRIPFRRPKTKEVRVPMRKFADERIAFTSELESSPVIRLLNERGDPRDMYEQLIHKSIRFASAQINEGEMPTTLLIGEIPDEVKENLKSTILDLDAKLVDIKENHFNAIMKRKYADKADWEEYTARDSYLRGYKHEQSVKGEIPTMVESILYDLYDMAFMAQLQSTTDHEFTHRADISSYLLGTDYSQYDEEGNIITPYDIEQYGEDEYTTRVSESTPQVIQSQYPYVGIEIYPTNPGYYIGLIWINRKLDYTTYREIVAKGLEEAEALEKWNKDSHGKFNEYYPTFESLLFALVRAPNHYTAKKLIKEDFSKTAAGKDGVIYFNPSKKPKAVRIEESPNKEKKLVAYFYDKDGKKFRTVHFGARGMSDYTQHKDPKRMKRYLARHGGMGENWKDPMTAGALSRWILWGKPSLRESFNDYKNRFKLEGVMAVTNTRMNPHHCPIEVEARRAAADPSFKHHEWYIEHHLEYVMAIAKAIVNSDEEEDQQLIHDMVWMHDYPKMLGDNDNFELVRELVSKHRSERYTDRLMNQLRWMEEIKSLDWSGRTTTIAAVMSTADALAHYYGPFWQIYMDENPDTPIEELKQSNAKKLEKDKRKLRAGPMEDGLDSVKFQYKGRKVRVVGNEHIAELIARKNPMAPGYQSYGWTTQDWRSIKVNNKGDIDYSEKCGAEGTKTPSGSPRLCLPAAVVKSLIRTESGKEVIRKQARKKARAKKGERVPWHPRIKKIWKRIEDKTVKDKPNPPSFISARDPQKWSDRYDKIIKMSGDQLMELAEKQASEKGLSIELTVENREYKENPRQLKLPPKQQKMYKEYIESIKRATITLSRGNKLIDTLRFTILTQSPKELVDYLTNRKVWRKERNGKSLPQIGSVRTQYVSNKSQRMFRVSEIPMVATLQNNKRFPFAVAGGGGYQMSEGQTSKGYYGIIKTYQAGFLEANNMEQYGEGASPMRSDLYQSYGWLTAFSYKDNYPYPSKAAEYYLNVAGKSKLANKDADYWNVYRPVYSRKMTGAAYRAGVKKMLETISNPPYAARPSPTHGKGLFATDDISEGVTLLDMENMRYLNHSSSPNIVFQWSDDELMTGVTSKKIRKGEEIVGDYQQLAKLTGHPAADKDVPPETLFNPPEWRHGEFAEEDPFEEYF